MENLIAISNLMAELFFSYSFVHVFFIDERMPLFFLDKNRCEGCDMIQMFLFGYR